MGPDLWAGGLRASAGADAAALGWRLYDLALDNDCVERRALRVEQQPERRGGEFDVKGPVDVALLLDPLLHDVFKSVRFLAAARERGEEVDEAVGVDVHDARENCEQGCREVRLLRRTQSSDDGAGDVR